MVDMAILGLLAVIIGIVTAFDGLLILMQHRHDGPDAEPREG